MTDDLNPLSLDIEHPSWYWFAACRHAMTVPERFGVWGGLSERERRRLRRHAA